MPVTTPAPLQAWLGHKNIQHTVGYTELVPDRFKEFWRYFALLRAAVTKLRGLSCPAIPFGSAFPLASALPWLRRLALRGMAHTKVNAVTFICFFNEKIFQSIFAVRRREWLLADLAMDH